MLQAAFEAASSGQPQTVVIEGEAGIGKTTLVERLVGRLPGVRLLRASGDEAEAHVPFAMADQLLRSAALTTDALQAGHHVPVGMELLELMTSGSGDTPTVIVIDEGHLVDAESLRALLFAARRLAGSRVLLLLVVRGVARGHAAGRLAQACGPADGPRAPGRTARARPRVGAGRGAGRRDDAGRGPPAVRAHQGQPAAHTRGARRTARGRHLAARAPRAPGAQVIRAADAPAARPLRSARRRPDRDGLGTRRPGTAARCRRAHRVRIAVRDARRRRRERTRAPRRRRVGRVRRVLPSADPGGDLRGDLPRAGARL